MAQELRCVRRSLAAAAAPLTTKEIQDRHMKHIAKISAHLATEPIQSEELTYEQQDWFDRKMAMATWPKPCRPWAPIEIPYSWIDTEREDTET